MTDSPKYMPFIVLDFDGVIHSYRSGWKGMTSIPDPPADGAFDALRNYSKSFRVCILSSRSADPDGMAAMKKWFIDNGWPADETGNPADLEFPLAKPPALLTIDDRAFCFQGRFPSVNEIIDFKPWYNQA